MNCARCPPIIYEGRADEAEEAKPMFRGSGQRK